MKQIALIDYGAGNLRSVYNALNRLGVKAVVTADPDLISQADKVIFPGVGHAGTAMESLKKSGLDQLIPQLTQPVLGICLGMQLLCARSEEGAQEGLGLLDQKVKKFTNSPKTLHMGWNSIQGQQGPLFDGIPQGSHFYFVHGYYVPVNGNTLAASHYGQEFSAAVQKGPFYGVQFHPEKSGVLGAKLLANFINLKS